MLRSKRARKRTNWQHTKKTVTIVGSRQRWVKPIRYTRGSHRWKEITESFVHFMVKEMIPINTVEKPGFCSMVRSEEAGPRYEPSRKYFSKTALPSLYAEIHERVSKNCWKQK